MIDERRCHQRYNNKQLALNVAQPGIKGFLRLNPTVECLNFSLTGLQFVSRKRIRPGSPLILDLCVDDIELLEFYGEVVSCQAEGDEYWRIGVRFRLDDKRMRSRKIAMKLLKIEDRLRAFTNYPETA